MDEVADNGAAEFGHSKEAAFEEGRFIFEKILNAADTRNSGNSEDL